VRGSCRLQEPSGRNTSQPSVAVNIRGTRLPVTVFVGSLAGGMTFEEVQGEYDVTADDIRTALRFVGELAGVLRHPIDN
jgi:hypothetical protein